MDDSGIHTPTPVRGEGREHLRHRRSKSHNPHLASTSLENLLDAPQTRIRANSRAGELFADMKEATEDFMTGCRENFDHAKEIAEMCAKKVYDVGWKVTHFGSLPDWLQDNDYLHKYHRPPLNSFKACFKSIFRIHTETGNIWTHMLGCFAFVIIAAWFISRPDEEIQTQEKWVYSAFFLGAILCLGLSFCFHTVSCHSQSVAGLFSKLDYMGISLLIVGSFVPWVFYGFYCHFKSKLIYLALVTLLGILAIVVSMWEKFSEPNYRSLRAGVFVAFGGVGIVPAVHYMIMEGVYQSLFEAALGWLILMAALYVIGALLYALRIPERYFPGKCDLMFQSHQIFHLFVIAAAFVHFHGINELAMYRLHGGACEPEVFPNLPVNPPLPSS